MKKLYLFILFLILFSCSEKKEAKPGKEEIEKTAYDVCAALKKNDTAAFKTYFEPNGFNNIRQAQFIKMFTEYRSIAEKYDLPDYNAWKKKRIFFNNDSLVSAIRIGMPFYGNSASNVPEYYFRIKYDIHAKIKGFTLTKVNNYKLPNDTIIQYRK
jgi:hypothetical protein